MHFNGADDDLDDLVDFLDMGDDSDSDENELINSDKNTVECAAPDSDSDDDCGMNVAETETSNKCKNDKFNKKKQLADSSQLKHTKVKSEEEEIQSIKDEIKSTKEKLAVLKKKLAEKEHLRDAKKSKTVEKSDQVNSSSTKTKYESGSHAKEKIEKTPEESNILFKKKERVAHATKREPKMDRSGIDNIQYEKKKMNIDKERAAPSLKRNEEEPPWQMESYSGIRIVNPRISNQEMETKMDDRRFIKLHMLANYLSKGDITGDWVTMGVVVKKLLPKTAANGKTFSIWKLSDLAAGKENSAVTFFLFGDVYKEYWKMAEGNVIALLNAAIMPQRDNDELSCVAITLDNPRKLMILGTSKDFGYCQATTKVGKQCNFIVNRFHGDFCEHHISREYKKIKSKRMEFQSASVGPDARKARNMNSVKKEIHSGQLYYGGQALTWHDKGASKKKADAKKQTLSALMGSSTTDSHMMQTTSMNACKKDKDQFEVNGLSEEFKDRLRTPTVGSRNLKKFLQKDEEEKQIAVAEKVEVKSAKDLIKEEKELKKKKLKPAKIEIASLKPKLSTPPAFNSKFKPVIGGVSKEDDFIEFCDSDDIVSDSLNSRTPSDVPVGSSLKKTPLVPRPAKPNEAKMKAISLLRAQKIKIDSEETETNAKKKSPEFLKKIKDRVRKNTIDEDSENHEPSKKRRKGILDDALGVLDLESEEGKKILKTQSAHADTVQRAEAEREAAYFSVLEKKEMYEEKMKNITEMDVKVVCCKICKYMHEFQSSYCKDKGHFTVKVDAVKRFFMCKNCKHRTTSFKKLPVQPCSNCGAINFERTSMFQEKKGPRIGAETLLVRGEEHSKFLTSLK